MFMVGLILQNQTSESDSFMMNWSGLIDNAAKEDATLRGPALAGSLRSNVRVARTLRRINIIAMSLVMKRMESCREIFESVQAERVVVLVGRCA